MFTELGTNLACLVLNIWFTRSLASRLPIATPLTVNVVNPGFCRSELTRHVSGIRWLIIEVMKLLLARTTEMGSRTLVHAALAGTQSEVQGRYLDTCRVGEESDYVIGEEGSKVEDRVWVSETLLVLLYFAYVVLFSQQETIDILSRVDSRVKSIVSQYLTHP